jgi:hypothetical protein
MSAVSEELEERRLSAFNALGAIAADFAARGRLFVAASAKPAVRERVGFDESALGYRTFREFLTDAERNGAVRLVYGRAGDVEILGPEAEAIAETHPPTEQAAHSADERVRPDLWNAVTDLDADRSWWYDPKADIVVTDASSVGLTGLVAVPSLGPDQEQWISEFVVSLPESSRLKLEAELAAASTVPLKLKLVSARPEFRRRWYDLRTARVREALERWKREHSLDVDLVDRRQQPRKAISSPARQKGSTKPVGAQDDDLRDRLHRAIERMPRSELLRISLPIEYLLDA